MEYIPFIITLMVQMEINKQYTVPYFFISLLSFRDTAN